MDRASLSVTDPSGGGEHMKAVQKRVVSAVAASGSLLCLIATVAAGVKWN